MCGIAGIVRRSGSADLGATIRRVTGAMAHRGPDAEDFFVTDEVALGHRRLSILDLSTAANCPFTDHSGRYVMVFNGEIYNYQEIKAHLKEYPFLTTGDTEVVIAAFAKWGPECLHRFKGMFAIAIWDKHEQSLFLARDRFGVKPLYYFSDDSQLLFASEIRSLLASGAMPRKLNREALVDYLKYQSFSTPYTIIENILEVRAGCWMTCKDGVCRQQQYWDITRVNHDAGEMTLPRVHERIRELLTQAVQRRLVSDVPLGAFLSGGIDSSLVVAIMSQVNKGATNAFTIAFEEKEYDEFGYASLVAKKFGVQHQRVLLKPTDFLHQLPEALDAMDTPSGDGLNTYVVSKAIRKSGIVVALSGVGGDELFAGYPQFRQYHRIRKMAGLFDSLRPVRRAVASLLPASDQRSIRLKSLLAAPSSEIADIYTVFRSIQTKDNLRRLLPGYEGGMTLEKYLHEKRADINRFDSFSQLSIADYLGYTQSVLLKDADQMSMASSLELREPFFDHDLAEYVLNIPDELKFPRYPKSLLVESFGGLLPEEVVFRKKQGFVLPYNDWTRNQLRSFCTEKMNHLAQRGYFSAPALLSYWDDYLQGRANIRWADIWIFIVLAHWLDKNEVS